MLQSPHMCRIVAVTRMSGGVIKVLIYIPYGMRVVVSALFRWIFGR